MKRVFIAVAAVGLLVGCSTNQGGSGESRSAPPTTETGKGALDSPAGGPGNGVGTATGSGAATGNAAGGSDVP